MQHQLMCGGIWHQYNDDFLISDMIDMSELWIMGLFRFARYNFWCLWINCIYSVYFHFQKSISKMPDYNKSNSWQIYSTKWLPNNFTRSESITFMWFQKLCCLMCKPNGIAVLCFLARVVDPWRISVKWSFC